VKKFFPLLCFLFLFSCGKPDADSVAEKYCRMVEKYANAETPEQKAKIRKRMNKYLARVRYEYADQIAFSDSMEAKMGKCLDELVPEGLD